MDENLVNRLRSLAGIIPQKHTLPSGADTVICSLEAFMQIKELAEDAANALEELSKRVPPVPHGRLGDLDALMRHCVMLPRDGGNLPVVYASYVRNAPTIIPAEEEER